MAKAKKFVNTRPSPATQALLALPPGLQVLIKQHPYNTDQEELVQNVWAALLDAQLATDGDNSAVDCQAVFNRARSATRRYGQDYAHYATSLDDVAETELLADEHENSPLLREEYIRMIAKEFGVTVRRAQQMAKAQLASIASGNDLFA